MFKINFKKLAICLLLTQTFIVMFSSSTFAAPATVDPNDLIFNNTGNIGKKIMKQLPETSGTAKDFAAQDNVTKLPDLTLEQVVGNAVKTVLKVTMYLTIISIVVAAVYYIISLGKEEDLTKARNIILYLVIGMAIISAAYAFTFGISKFNFFQDQETTQDTPPA